MIQISENTHTHTLKHKKKQIKQFDTQQQVPCEMRISTDRTEKNTVLGVTNRTFKMKHNKNMRE